MPKDAPGNGGKGINLALVFSGVLILILMSVIVETFILAGQLSMLQTEQNQTQTSLLKTQADFAKLNASNAKMAQEKKMVEYNLSLTNEQLRSANSQITALQASLDEKETELAQSQQSLEEQQAKVGEIVVDLNTMEKNINESMAWFKENAIFPISYNGKTSIFHKRINDCVDNGYLNLACLNYLMENTAFSIHYRTDIQSTGKADFLQSTKQTIDSGWGDCEDYSLLYKSILNMVKNEQGSLGVLAWTPGGTDEFRIYPKESIPLAQDETYWYYGNTEGAVLGNFSTSYFYVICYAMDAAQGHCTLAVSKEKIETSSELNKLNGAYVVEPQSGKYLGIVGQDFGICDRKGCDRQAYVISTVIADDDLYTYSNTKWVGYKDFQERITEAQAQIGG